jgi:peptidoglycan/xylan/chitin deacetylase (PgdA/CDA1 family)
MTYRSSATSRSGRRCQPCRDSAIRRRGGIALLTFDDAYRSLADLGQPLLARLGIPAVLFAVAGGLLGRGDPFPHFMHELQDKWPTLPPVVQAEIDGHPAIKTVVARAALTSPALTSVAELLPRETAPETGQRARSAGLADLAPSSASRRPPGRTMTSFTALLAQDIELGAHSLTHRAFVHLDNETTEREIVESTAVVADLVGKSPASIGFAYPYGFVTAHAASVVARHCAAGFTCHERPLSPVDRSPMLPRVNLDSRTRLRSRGPILGSLREERCSTREPIWATGDPTCSRPPAGRPLNRWTAAQPADDTRHAAQVSALLKDHLTGAGAYMMLRQRTRLYYGLTPRAARWRPSGLCR